MPSFWRSPTWKIIKTTILKSAKFGLVIGIIAWLVASDRIDMTKVIEFFRNPRIVLWALFSFFFGGVFLGGLRWFILLRAAGIRPRLAQIVTIHWIGSFFNIVMPGAVGGDVIKALYVMRDAAHIPKTRVMMTVFLDRLLGLAGLFLLGALVTLIDLRAALAINELRPILAMLALLLALVGVLFAVVFVSPPRFLTQRDRRSRIEAMRVLKPFIKVYLALRDYRHSPMTLIGAILISMGVQLIIMTYCWQVTQALADSNTDFTRFAAVFPVGILVTAVPIAPGGIGVGHIAFDKLFHMVDLARGADMFNIYLLGNLCLSMSGLLPYLLFKRERMDELVEKMNQGEQQQQV